MSTAFRSYDDGYVEVVYRPSGSGVLPHLELSDLEWGGTIDSTHNGSVPGGRR
jgi:hypothetical protein